ncbi:MAG: Fibronectin type-III protein [Parcubacteria group bacterium]|nr:Fibronectin type-III protein [Parcubacteria group bacterium]
MFLISNNSFADEFTSTNFRVLDPVIVPSAFSTSTGFQLWSNISELALGTSTAAAFKINSGFLFYPYASSPVVTSAAGDAQANLSWTASSGFLGWNVAGYNVGQSTTSGGPYSYTSVGDVTSSARTGLTNGTAYYFVVVAKDAFANPVATSTQVSVTPVSAGGGVVGGGGGGSPISATSVIFSGRAYPKTTVTLLKDAQIAATTVAGADANFQITLSNLSGGNYIFSVYSEDKNGNRSSLLTFPVSVTAGVTTNVGGIFIAPTIAVDKSEVKRGDNIAIFGQSAPKTEITISINSEEEFFNKTDSDSDGIYLYNFDTSILEMGQHLTKSKAALKGEISSFSKAVGFIVGTKNVVATIKAKCSVKADLNSDCKVNLVDFSIAAYWYKRTLSADFAKKEKEKLSGDNKISLTDFSIMAFYWTG